MKHIKPVILLFIISQFLKVSFADTVVLFDSNTKTREINLANSRYNGSFIQYTVDIKYKKPRTVIDPRTKDSVSSSTQREIYIHHCTSNFRRRLYTVDVVDDSSEQLFSRLNLDNEYIRSNDKEITEFCKKNIVDRDHTYLRDIAIPDSMIVDLKDLSPGEHKEVTWGKRSVFIYHRTKEDIQRLLNSEKSRAYDYTSTGILFSSWTEGEPYDPITYSNEPLRSKKSEYLVVFRHVGLKGGGRFYAKINQLDGPGFRGPFGGMFDLSGRILAKTPSPSMLNLPIPIHNFISDNKILLGAQSNTAQIRRPKNPIMYEGLDKYFTLLSGIHARDYQLTKKALKANRSLQDPRLPELHAFEWALYRSSLDIIELLLQNGADPNQVFERSNDKTSPLYIAKQRRNQALTDLLIKYGATRLTYSRGHSR